MLFKKARKRKVTLLQTYMSSTISGLQRKIYWQKKMYHGMVGVRKRGEQQMPKTLLPFFLLGGENHLHELVFHFLVCIAPLLIPRQYGICLNSPKKLVLMVCLPQIIPGQAG